MNKYCVLLLALARPASAADRIFTGSLTHVGHFSIAILMADRLRVDAAVPAGIAIPYQVHDQVEITCTAVKSFLPPRDQIHYQLELKSVRLVKAATAAERAPAAIASDPQFDLDRVRRVNPDYALKLPNFVADEISRTYTSDDAGAPEAPHSHYRG